MKKVLILALLAGVSSVYAMDYEESRHIRVQLQGVDNEYQGLQKLVEVLESQKQSYNQQQEILQADEQSLAVLPVFIESLKGVQYNAQTNQIYWKTDKLKDSISQQFGVLSKSFSRQQPLSKFEQKHPRAASMMKKVNKPWIKITTLFGLGAGALYVVQLLGILPSPS